MHGVGEVECHLGLDVASALRTAPESLPHPGPFLDRSRGGLGLGVGRSNKTLAVGAESNAAGKTDTRGRRGRSK